MHNVRFVGLDVHKDTITIAVAEPDGSEPATLATVAYDEAAIVKRLRRLGNVKVCYEAGPTGFGLQRALTAADIDCILVAPSLVPSRAGDRIKTDRRDAVRLARFLRSGDLTPIHVPDEQTEAMRDLERARDDAKNAERRARQQLGKFLLRHGRRYSKKTTWSQRHIEWIAAQKFEHEAQQRVLVDYVRAVETASARVAALDKSIAELVERWSHAPLVKALQALRGISLTSAVIIAAELGDLRRFPKAPMLMAYLGLVPSEHSSGGTRRRGPITRTGNGHVRRILVEAAWAYRYNEQVSAPLRKRQLQASEQVRKLSWRAQQRLCQRYRKFSGRGMNKQRTVVAIARELAAFIWELGQMPPEQLLAA